MIKHYVDINGVNLGPHGAAPRNSVCELDASLVGKAVKVVDITESMEVEKVAVDENGDPVMVQEVDENGDPRTYQPTDIEGNPVGDVEAVMINQIEVDENGDPVMETIVNVIGKEAVIDQPAEDIRIAAVAAQAVVDAEEAKISQMQDRFGAVHRIKAKIALVNESKSMDAAQIAAFLSDPVIQNISMLLAEISLGTAKAVLEAADVSAYYTDEEKQSIVDAIQAHLDTEA